MIGTLPKALEVGGVSYPINTDFRDVLDVLEAFDDPNLTDNEKIYICLSIIYENLDDIPQGDYEEAYKEAVAFIDHGISGGSSHIKTMDWEKDEALIFSAINKVAGKETRECEYIHWWTFLGYYMEIGDGIFSKVVSIRAKKAKHKKLEKWEQEFVQANPNLVKLERKRSDEEKANIDRLNKMLNGG